ncbi:unnamed protein product, partial [Iphiclides podalirius]
MTTKATTIKEAIKKWEEKSGQHAGTATEELPNLDDLLFVGNPLYDACELDVWRAEAARRLPQLKKLDGETVLREDDPPLTVANMQPDGGDAVETLVSAENND